MSYLNQIDLKDIVQAQFNRSNITEASTYNYVNSLNELLKDHRYNELSLQVIGELKFKMESLQDPAEKSYNMHFIHFLEDYIMERPSKPNHNVKVRCQYCCGLASLKPSMQIYKGKDHGLVYICENYGNGCDAYVASHKGDNLPLGTLADTTTRSARQKAHKVVDVLWREYGFARVDVYKQLANYLGVKPNNCHIGKFNATQCESAINFTKMIIS